MTWFNPAAYTELFACDHCGRDFEESDLKQYNPNFWVCAGCASDLDKDAARFLDCAGDYVEAAQ